MDFNLFGHQIVAHLVDGYSAAASHNKGAGQGGTPGLGGTAVQQGCAAHPAVPPTQLCVPPC